MSWSLTRMVNNWVFSRPTRRLPSPRTGDSISWKWHPPPVRLFARSWITVSSGSADHFTVVSTEDPIEVGTERNLQVRLYDEWDNSISGSTVTFTRTTGNGLFTGDVATIDDATDATGLAEALYTASDDVSYGSDVIQVEIGAVNTTITLSLETGAISYYALSPTGAQGVTANTGIAYTITAYDQYDNIIVNSDSLDLSAIGSTSAGFTASRLYFSGSAVSFNVADQTSGAFAVKATSATNSGITGESGLVTVDPDSAEHIVVTSSLAALTVGTDRQIQLTLEDQYGNPLPSETVTLRATTGDGNFGGNVTINVPTNISGVVTATYTASSDLLNVTDVIEVTFGPFIDTTIAIPLQGGGISYYTFAPSGDVSFTAGGVGVDYTITARDQFGNDYHH